jgi:hypothetical protein
MLICDDEFEVSLTTVPISLNLKLRARHFGSHLLLQLCVWNTNSLLYLPYEIKKTYIQCLIKVFGRILLYDESIISVNKISSCKKNPEI